MSLPVRRAAVSAVAVVCLLTPRAFASAIFIALEKPGVDQTEIAGAQGSRVVGDYTSGSVTHGFSDDRATWPTLDAPGAPAAGPYGNGIDANKIVRNYYDNDGFDHGFIYDLRDTTWAVLDVPSLVAGTAPGSSGTAISGMCSNGSVLHGFLHDGSIWTTVDHLPGILTQSVVPSRGSLTTVDNPLGVQGTMAVGIDGGTRASEPTTLPEPTTLALFPLVGGSLLLRQIRRWRERRGAASRPSSF